MKTRRLPGFEKAMAWLNGPPENRSGLSIRKMAAAADVSYVTMWKALRQRDHRAGLAARDSAPPAAASVPASRRLKQRIEADLLQGRIPRAGAMPQIKDLCRRYQAGYRTVRAALESLRRDDLLRREGLHYSIDLETPSKSSLKIAVLAVVPHYMSPTDPVALVAEYDQDFMRNLELSSGAAQVGMELLGYRHERGNLAVFDAQQKRHRTLSAEYAGYIVLMPILEAVGEDLFTQLHTTGKPVAIIDEIGGWELPAYAARSKRFLVVNARPYENAGIEVGRALMSLGHRRCAYFSTFHADLWSRQCLKGLSDVFSTAGDDCIVVPHLIEGSQVMSQPSQWSRLEKTFNALRAKYQHARSTLSRAFVRQLNPYFDQQLAQQLVYANVRDQLEPLLAKARADASITCWIAADVDTAWFTNDYLEEHGRRASLVTFGWSPEVTRSRIAAYDFNSSAAVRATLDFLLYPRRRLPEQEGVNLRIRGTMVYRESLKAA